MELLIIISLFILAALISAVVKRQAVMGIFSIVAALVAVIGSTMISIGVAKTGSYNPISLFSVASFGALLLLVISIIGFAVVIYSIKYLRKEFEKNIIGPGRVKQYFVLLNLFLAAMFLAVTSSSPIFAWISIEATTLSTAFLISFYNKPSAVEAAWKYLIINSIGLLLGFFGTLLYFTALPSSDGFGIATWQTLLQNISNLDPSIVKIAFVFVLVGYGTKVGFVPMHTWKPDAYGKSPAPLGALFSGALLPVAFFVILKFKAVTDSVVGANFSQGLFIVFGVLSVIIPALILLIIKDYKRLLAYSSIENAGIMALGFGFGGLGVVAAISHMIYHSFIKSTLFFLSGNFLLKYHSAKIFNVRGALKVLPMTSVLFLVGFLAVAGMPPFGIFFTKLSIFSAGIQNHLAISILVMLGTVLVFIGFFKHVTAMIFGEKPVGMEKEKENFWLIFPPLLLLLLVLILSFYEPVFVETLINGAALQY